MKNLLNVCFLGVYIEAFYLWRIFPLHPVAIIAVIATWLVLMQLYKKYFINPYEKFFFYLIGLDLLLESFLQPQEGVGFYWCAIAFAAVILVYRKLVEKGCAKKCLLSGEELNSDSH